MPRFLCAAAPSCVGVAWERRWRQAAAPVPERVDMLIVPDSVSTLSEAALAIKQPVCGGPHA